jgi:hypothetical protein
MLLKGDTEDMLASYVGRTIGHEVKEICLSRLAYSLQ